MLADIVITSSWMTGFCGWGALICFGFCALEWLYAATYHKCDDWWTAPIAMVIGSAVGVMGIIFGLIWIGSRL